MFLKEDSRPPNEEGGAGAGSAACSRTERGEGKAGLLWAVLFGIASIRRRGF
jgi:hypothetical protein